jgi:ComF family protein
VLPGDLPVHAAFGAGPTLFAILHEGKYRGRRTLLDRLGAELAALVARRAALREAALFVPVPLHPGRLRERGFNQSEILARLAASAAGVGGAPLARRLLARRRDTRPQARLAPGRRASNVRGAFRLAAPLPAELKRRRAIVVDDVVTSGATVLECAALLRAAGAGEVHALTLVKG